MSENKVFFRELLYLAISQEVKVESRHTVGGKL
jgi:hypothetical protein